MGLFDALDFEAFNLKDMFEKIKDEPLAALLGGLEPAGAALWKGLGVLPSDYEPAVNVFGGPYGGGTLGLDNNAGVFGRAQEQGIDTGTANIFHDIAESVAASYAGGYGFDQLGSFLNVDPQFLQTGANLAQNPPQIGGGTIPPRGAETPIDAARRQHAESLLLQALRLQEQNNPRRSGL